MEIMYDVGIASMVVIVTEAVKSFNIPKKYIPIISIAFGILFSIMYQGANPDAIQHGIIVGGLACGIYSGGKTIFKDKAEYHEKEYKEYYDKEDKE